MYASGEGTGATPGVQAHAVSTIECMDCHAIPTDGSAGHWMYPEYQDCDACHWAGKYTDDFISAGGFGFGTTDNDMPPTGGKRAAHKQFVLDAINNTLMEGSNEACIACHTGIPVQINWTHAMNLVLNATYIKSKKVPPTHFEAHNFSANGTVIVISYGNWSGGAKNGSWPSGDIDIWGYNKAP